MIDTADMNFPKRPEDLDVLFETLGEFPTEHDGRQRMTLTGRPPTTPPMSVKPQQQNLL